MRSRNSAEMRPHACWVRGLSGSKGKDQTQMIRVCSSQLSWQTSCLARLLVMHSRDLQRLQRANDINLIQERLCV